MYSRGPCSICREMLAPDEVNLYLLLPAEEQVPFLWTSKGNLFKWTLGRTIMNVAMYLDYMDTTVIISYPFALEPSKYWPSWSSFARFNHWAFIYKAIDALTLSQIKNSYLLPFQNRVWCLLVSESKTFRKFASIS